MAAPYWQSPVVTLYHCDARDLPLEDKSVHCVVTSPPYFGLRKYSGVGDGGIGNEESVQEYIAHLVEVFQEVYRVLRDDGVLWADIGDSYGDGGNLLGVPWRLALALQEDGWILRSDVIWNKPSCMPESLAGWRYERCEPAGEHVLRKGSWRSTNSHEYIFMFVKGMGYYGDGEAVKLESGANRRSVWSDISAEHGTIPHYATFPEDLPKLCILSSTSEAGCCAGCGAAWARVVEHDRVATRPNNTSKYGDLSTDIRASGTGNVKFGLSTRVIDTVTTLGFRPSCGCNTGVVPAIVLDPFGGVATTAVAAQRLGRRAICVDLSKEYLDLAVKRLEAVTLPLL